MVAVEVLLYFLGPGPSMLIILCWLLWVATDVSKAWLTFSWIAVFTTTWLITVCRNLAVALGLKESLWAVFDGLDLLCLCLPIADLHPVLCMLNQPKKNDLAVWLNSSGDKRKLKSGLASALSLGPRDKQYCWTVSLKCVAQNEGQWYGCFSIDILASISPHINAL